LRSPLISIITLTLNAEEHLDQTIQSVFNQTYNNIEYIIVDGGSTDHTLEIINRHRNRVHHLISENDKGIADGMNKGVALASGEYILFLHADDYLIHNNSLASACEFLEDTVDILVCSIRYGKGLKIVKPHGFNFWTNFKGLPHQGILCRKALIEHLNGFDTQFKICMDYDLLLRVYQNGARLWKSPVVLSVMRDTGISSRKDWQSLKKRFDEERKVHLKNCTSLPMKILYRIYWFLYLPYRRSLYKLKASLPDIKIT